MDSPLYFQKCQNRFFRESKLSFLSCVNAELEHVTHINVDAYFLLLFPMFFFDLVKYKLGSLKMPLLLFLFARGYWVGFAVMLKFLRQQSVKQRCTHFNGHFIFSNIKKTDNSKATHNGNSCNVDLMQSCRSLELWSREDNLARLRLNPV